MAGTTSPSWVPENQCVPGVHGLDLAVPLDDPARSNSTRASSPGPSRGNCSTKAGASSSNRAALFSIGWSAKTCATCQPTHPSRPHSIGRIRCCCAFFLSCGGRYGDAGGHLHEDARRCMLKVQAVGLVGRSCVGGRRRERFAPSRASLGRPQQVQLKGAIDEARATAPCENPSRGPPGRQPGADGVRPRRWRWRGRSWGGAWDRGNAGGAGHSCDPCHSCNPGPSHDPLGPGAPRSPWTSSQGSDARRCSGNPGQPCNARHAGDARDACHSCCTGRPCNAIARIALDRQWCLGPSSASAMPTYFARMYFPTSLATWSARSLLKPPMPGSPRSTKCTARGCGNRGAGCRGRSPARARASGDPTACAEDSIRPRYFADSDAGVAVAALVAAARRCPSGWRG
jgi:hypothetical protein